MLIQGSPDILRPPSTPSMGGLGNAQATDPYWSNRVGQVQSAWSDSQRVINTTLAVVYAKQFLGWLQSWGWTAQDMADAAGISLDEFSKFLRDHSSEQAVELRNALQDVASVWDMQGPSDYQKAGIIRDIAQANDLQDSDVSSVVGMTVEELRSWLYDTDNHFRSMVAPILNAAWLSSAQIGSGLRAVAYKHALSATDLARITGLSLSAINGYLSASGPSMFSGTGLGIDATVDNPGLAIASTGIWAVVPRGSDPIDDVYAGTADRLVVKSTAGVLYPLPVGGSMEIRLPLSSSGAGAVQSIMGNASMTLAEKSRRIAAIQAKYGASDAEMQWFGADVGGLTYAQFQAAGGATYYAYTPDEIRFQARSDSSDPALWDVFYGIWSDPALTLAQKVDAVAAALTQYRIGVYDLATITGFDAVAWAQVLSDSQTYQQSLTIPEVMAPAQEVAPYQVQQSAPSQTASTAAVYATAPGGIGLDAMYQNIRDYISAAGNDYSAVVAGMAEYGVSLDDIRAALFDMGRDAWIAGLANFIKYPPPPVQVKDDTGTVVDDGQYTITPMIIVYGPDGTMYPNPAAAEAAGVTNWTTYDPTRDQLDVTTLPGGPGEIVDTTTGAPAMITVPANITTWTANAKAAWYRAQREAGFSDAEVRAAVEAALGPIPAGDWAALQALAYPQAAGGGAAPAGGAAITILALAAAFLLR